MTADAWTTAVRRQLGLGRVLPLGGARDGAWITEAAAVAVLRRAAVDVRGARLKAVRIALADPDPDPYRDPDSDSDSDSGHAGAAPAPSVPAPPGALPPGALRVTADFLASADADAAPFPVTAARLRAALAIAATQRLGLKVTEVDLRVTGLLEDGEEAEEPSPLTRPPAEGDEGGREGGRGHEEECAEGEDRSPGRSAGLLGSSGSPDLPDPSSADEVSRVTAAALSVPGVTRLTGAPGGLDRAVHVETGPALPHRHIRVELAVTEQSPALDVARAVRRMVSQSLPDHPTVAVLVTHVDTAPR
ncbi:nucleopolyhedrovirus P10 family protein [Streptomyces sp. NPDC002643]